MKRKTETDFPETKIIKHRWPFLPNDNGRFTGRLIYRGVHTPPPEDEKPLDLLHQMQKPYANLGEVPIGAGSIRRFLCSYTFGTLRRLYIKNTLHHEDRMNRDQDAAQLRRQGILKTFNS